MKMTYIVLILSVWIGISTNGSAADRSVSKTEAVPVKSRQVDSYRDDDEKYAAYKMDGVTSASKLAAQRSHTVAGKDERNFAVFSAITVILIIYFVTQFEFFDK